MFRDRRLPFDVITCCSPKCMLKLLKYNRSIHLAIGSCPEGYIIKVMEEWLFVADEENNKKDEKGIVLICAAPTSCLVGALSEDSDRFNFLDTCF